MHFLVISILCLCVMSCLATTCSSSLRSEYSDKTGMKDMALEDGRLLEATLVDNGPQCFQQCSRDCRCLSFNLCGRTCQLNGGSRSNAPHMLRRKQGCHYHEMPVGKDNCEMKPVRVGVCCAKQPPVCHNGGTCYTNATDTTSRMQCACPSGYYGDRCRVKKPKRCADYWIDERKPISKKYVLVGANGDRYETFCDFDSEEGVVWTLAASFTMENLPSVKDYSFSVDQPMNENSFNWGLYRLPKSTMTDLAARATYWRGTCSYATYGVDYIDYTRFLMNDLDVLLSPGAICVRVDYMDIRGKQFEDCSTMVYAVSYHMFLMSTYHGRMFSTCTCDASSVEYICPGNGIEPARYLGWYQPCHDPSYRCSQAPSSTTEFWYGEIITT